MYKEREKRERDKKKETSFKFTVGLLIKEQTAVINFSTLSFL